MEPSRESAVSTPRQATLPQQVTLKQLQSQQQEGGKPKLKRSWSQKQAEDEAELRLPRAETTLARQDPPAKLPRTQTGSERNRLDMSGPMSGNTPTMQLSATQGGSPAELRPPDPP